MKRTSSFIACALWLSAFSAQAQAPDAFAGPTPAIHVVIDESIHPDLLRTFARRGITLWLQTRSNTLAASVIENVARFDTALVQFRAPVRDTDARLLAKAPRAGPWVQLADAAAVKSRMPGARKVAVDVAGPLSDEQVTALDAVKPWLTRWTVPAEADVLMWAHFAQVDGRKIARLADPQVDAATCSTWKTHSIAGQLPLASAPKCACRDGAFLVVDPSIELLALQAALSRDPSVQLVFEIGTDEVKARKVRALITALSDATLR